MVEIYDFKIIKSGLKIEVYDYKTKKMVRGYKRRPRTSKPKPKSLMYMPQYLDPEQIEQIDVFKYAKEVKKKKDEQVLKSEFSIHRTQKNIRRITNSNPQLKKFLTLTFAKSMPELTKANYLFKLAMNRILTGKPEFEYISIVEFQKDIDYHGRVKPDGGSVHYHLLCNIETIIKRDRFEWERWFQRRYWKYGFVKIKNVTTVDNMGAYFCKYLSKDMYDKRMFGKKKYFCSRTLKKPVEIIGYEARIFFERFLKNLEPTYKNTHKGEYSGLVEYSSYSLCQSE